jgi:hypothetical protein
MDGRRQNRHSSLDEFGSFLNTREAVMALVGHFGWTFRDGKATAVVHLQKGGILPAAIRFGCKNLVIDCFGYFAWMPDTMWSGFFVTSGRFLLTG